MEKHIATLAQVRSALKSEIELEKLLAGDRKTNRIATAVKRLAKLEKLLAAIAAQK